MATAITSLALQGHAGLVSAALLWLAASAFAVLSVRVAAGVLAGGERLAAELHDPATAFGSLCVVAAAGALSTRAHTNGNAWLADALAVVAGASCLVLMAVVAGTVARRRHRVGSAMSGTWLLAVVASQTLAIVCATAARTAGLPSLAVAGAAAWLTGIALYLVLAAPLAARLRRLAARRRFSPDYWILMGALAISALAATVLVHAPGTPLRGGLRAGGVVAWIGACAWIPLLAVADLRAAGQGDRDPLSARARWSMVFPLAMFSASAQAYAHVEHTSALARIGTAAAWVALVAWCLVAALVAREWSP
jgi:tellurite resistance protein TehA-like permease